MMYPRDYWSFYTHFIGAVLSLMAIVFLVVKPLISGFESVPSFVGGIIFGLSLLALYSASSIYHYVKLPKEALIRLRKLDHAMIYILIAGSYTPVTLGFMTTRDATIFLAVIWGIALAGIVMKMFWLNAPRLLYTSLYLLMGWAIVFDWKAFENISTECLGLIAAGGVCYTIGALFYAIKKPNKSEIFGFHEIFHVFVLIGSTLHFSAVYFCII